MQNKTFGESLKSYRLHKKFSQRDLALKVGISNVEISKYERNQHEPRISLLIKLCTVLECTADDLLNLIQPITKLVVSIECYTVGCGSCRFYSDKSCMIFKTKTNGRRCDECIKAET